MPTHVQIPMTAKTSNDTNGFIDNSEITPLLSTHDTEKGASIASSILNLAKSIIGAGVLALPFAISKLGLTLGLLYYLRFLLLLK